MKKAKTSFFIVAAIFLGGRALAGDWRLSLYNYHEGEYAEIVYKENGQYIPDGITRIKHILRSRGDGIEHEIDPRLINLIDDIEDRFGAETIEIISGYRSPAYNRSLKMEGRNVANESLHMRGQAADIHIDEINEKEIFDYVRNLRRGGAGLYPRYDFVHVDVGPVRSWREAEPTERILTGTENNPNSLWSAITDKNIYARGDIVKISVTNNDYKKQRPVKNFWIQRFTKGQWSEAIKVNVDENTKGLAPGQSSEFAWSISSDQSFGKYRFVIFASKDFSVPPAYSNEFYIKR